MKPSTCFAISGLLAACITIPARGDDAWLQVKPATPAQLYPLANVRLLPGPFAEAAAANRASLLAHDPDRLLAPFLREAGLVPKKPAYPNWESQGLDGHTAGHYLSALADMVASGNDPDGELGRRLDYMLSEMDRVQKANGNGYIGGIPGSREFWKAFAAGDVGRVWKKWVPWYNVHKTFAGLRDAYVEGHRPEARRLLVGLGDWCVGIISGLNDQQMQAMLQCEYGGMNETLADLYAITGDQKYLAAARRFCHHAVLDPLGRGEDRLTGLHANTQIPKVIGAEAIAILDGTPKEEAAARFFWETVVGHRSLAFGGNSVSEHFNDPRDFRKVLENREGPETCNTYNMLRLTEKLFANHPEAKYADYYERALYNHLLSAIDPKDPGYVYFTPIRPEHYRVYSKAGECFWCCVGTGMENPGRYGQFVYAQEAGAVDVNLFMPSELKFADGGRLRQETRFPFEPRTRLVLKLEKPATFALRLRHPGWVPEGQFAIRVNGQPVADTSKPSSYAELRRTWQDGDLVDVELPMHVAAEPLPDGSGWTAILYGPIVLAAPAGTKEMTDERASGGRMAHVAGGPLVPLDKIPVLLTTAEDLPKHVVPDPQAGPLRFRLQEVLEPKIPGEQPLEPFFALHHARYQMYWELTTTANRDARRQKLAAEEKLKADRETATLDAIAPGEQQSEVEHDFAGEETKTGLYQGRRWRDGKSLQYTLNPHGAKAADLAVTYWGGDAGRTFDILVNGKLLCTQELKAEKPGQFFVKRYPLPAEALAGGNVTVKFVAKVWVAGGLFDLRLIKPGTTVAP